MLKHKLMNGVSRQRHGWPAAGERGYSLLEIMVVVTMVGAIAAMAIGSYRTAVPQSRLREATTELHSTFGLARILAMSQNATVTVKLSGTGQAIVGSDVTMSGSYANPILVTLTRSIAGAETTIQSNPLTGEIASLTIAPGINAPPIQPWVRYNSMGLRAGTGNQIITLTNTQGRTYSVNVSPGGKAKWCIASICP
ncbi:MAG TPA: GspH/FimT family pseudopilin [Nitrospiraceae bacterium]